MLKRIMNNLEILHDNISLIISYWTCGYCSDRGYWVARAESTYVSSNEVGFIERDLGPGAVLTFLGTGAELQSHRFCVCPQVPLPLIFAWSEPAALSCFSHGLTGNLKDSVASQWFRSSWALPVRPSREIEKFK